jgi:polyisoprenoid-binding protein YceI
MTTATSVKLTPGTWKADLAHSSVEFVARHMMVAKVKGRFTSFDATITVGDDPLRSSVEASVDMASVDTHDENRDNHLRSTDFFDVEHYPKMTFRSTGIEVTEDGLLLHGDLTIKSTTKPVQFALEFEGETQDPYGNTRAGFTATGEIDRRDWGIDLAMPMEGGGVVVGNQIKISLEIEGILQQS